MELYFTYNNQERITSHIEANSFKEAESKNELSDSEVIRISEKDLEFIALKFEENA